MPYRHRPENDSPNLRAPIPKARPQDLPGILGQRSRTLRRFVTGRDFRPRRMQRVVNKVCAELLARGLVDEAIEFHAEYPCIDIMTRAEARLLVDAAVQAIAEAARQADNIFEYAIDRKSDERSTRQADATYQGEQAAKKEAARVEHKRKNEEAALAGVREKAWKKHKDFSEAYRLEQVRKAVEEHLEKWKRKSRQKK